MSCLALRQKRGVRMELRSMIKEEGHIDTKGLEY